MCFNIQIEARLLALMLSPRGRKYAPVLPDGGDER